jgi:hypothetical protein
MPRAYESGIDYEQKLLKAIDNLERWGQGSDTFITRENVRFLVDAYKRKAAALDAALNYLGTQKKETEV